MNWQQKQDEGFEIINQIEFSRTPDLRVEIIGVEKKMVSKEAKANQEPGVSAGVDESEAGGKLKAKRPPLRKYIRQEGTPGHQKMVVEVAEQKSSEISIASLKEKFGLSDSKIGGIIRDAEKLGKIKRSQNGSYAWT